MAARATMLNLVNRVRLLIADNAAPPSQLFSDDTIQEYLDRNRQDVRYLELEYAPTLVYGSNTLYLDYYSNIGGDWEEDEVLQDASFKDVTASVTTYDRLVGHWVFTVQPLFPVFITGKIYDIYASAADLLELWAAQLKLKFDFANGQQRMFMSQQIAGVSAMAAQYRAKAKPKPQQMFRDDLNY